MTPADLPYFVTVADAAAFLSCSRQTIYRLVDAGRLEAVNLATRPGTARTLRISSESLLGLFPAEEVCSS